MNRFAVVAVVAVATFASSRALADETPSAAPQDKAPAAASDKAPAEPETSRDEGLAGSVGLGILAPGGQVADGLDTPWGGAFSLDARLGYFVSKRVGLSAGVRYGLGHHMDGCTSSCGGHSLQIPVMVELDFERRTHGLYVELGAGLLTQYATSVGSDSIQASSPVDGKVGLGYRFPVVVDKAKGTGFLLDIHSGLDVGEFTHLSAKSGSDSVDGDIAGDKMALHHTVSFGVGFGF